MTTETRTFPVIWSDGSSGDVTVTHTPAPVPVPTPIPPSPPGPVPSPTGPIPAGSNTLQIGTATYPLAAVNPTPTTNPAGTGYPGCRGKDQVVGYQSPLTSWMTNGFGASLTLDAAGRVVVVQDDLAKATSLVTSTIPPDGCGLSGHGAGRDVLLRAKVGDLVRFSAAVPKPPAPATGGKTLAAYLQDGQDLDEIPDCYTQVRVAFIRMVGGVLTPAEWGGKTPAQTQAQLTTWAGARPSRQVLLATGGQGGGNNLGDVAAFCSGYRTLAPKYAAHGVDLDEEGVLDVAHAVSIGKALAVADPSVIISFPPPGGPPTDIALPAAKALHDAGVRVQFGFQGYDAVDSDDDIIGRTRTAVAALGAPQVLVGFMVGSDPKHRAPAQCESLMRKIVTLWPDIGGAYLWQMKASGTTEAARLLAAVLGL